MALKSIVKTQEVKYSNIRVCLKTRTVTLDVCTRKVGGKRWLKANSFEITAKLSQTLYQWLATYSVNHNGAKITPFQKYLINRNIQFRPGILKTMEFVSHNLSEDYKENPFKLLLFDDGSSQLTLVHLKNKIKNDKGIWVDQQKKYYSKHCFRRLVILTQHSENYVQ